MSTNLLAAWGHSIGEWGPVDWLVAVVIIAACIGIAVVALRVFDVTIPAWAVQIFWIVVAACVAILAIRFVASL